MSINLLPWRTEEIHDYRKKCSAFLAGFSVIFILLFSMLHLLFNQKTDHVTTEIHLLKNQITKIPLADIQNNQRFLKKLLRLQACKAITDEKTRRLLSYLTFIANDLPITATLNALTLSIKENTIAGECSALSDAHIYTQGLQKDLGAKEVMLSDLHNSSQNKAVFNFLIQVTP